MKRILLQLFSFFIVGTYFSQSNLGIQFQVDIPAICTELTMTMMHDTEDRPYLYIANKEAGLTIYDITSISAPINVATVPIDQYLDMHVMSLTQSGNYLYLATGNTWATDSSGVVIVDVQNPTLPVVTDFYFLPNSTHGAGIVRVEGNYAFLGAMQDGLITLDVTDKNNIQFVSQFVPDINYPINNPSNVDLYNLRGMEVRNDTVYACFDGGGIRIIDVTNKAMPVQIGQYCNPVMYTPMDHPKAYNNIVLRGSLAYLAVDYCGLEIVDVSDPANIELIGWWNPYGCPTNNWFTSPVHSNEIVLDENCEAVFLSTGKSEMMVVDVSNPAMPDSIDSYGDVTNTLGTWGINRFQDQVYLSYVCVPFGIPFYSNWTGVKILSYTNCTNNFNEIGTEEFTVFPNPANEVLTIAFESLENKNVDLELSSPTGQIVRKEYHHSNQNCTISVQDLPAGIYFLSIDLEDNRKTVKIVIEK